MAKRKRYYHRESRMSKAEVIVIMILFHSSGYRRLKHFYLEKVYKHMRHLFPEVVSYNRWSSESRSQTCLDYAESRQRETIVNRFVELEREIAIPLKVFIKKVLLGKCTGISFWTVPLCVYARIRGSIFTRHTRALHKGANAPWAGSLDSSFT